MAVSIATTVTGTGVVPQVMLVIDGLTLGTSLTATGRTVAGFEWPVRGVSGRTVDSTQLVVFDDLAPLAQEISYRVEVDGAVVVSAPLTLPVVLEPDTHLVSSLIGDLLVPVEWQDNDEPRRSRTQHSLTWVPGRPRPVVRWVPAGGESGTWLLVTRSPQETRALRDLVRDGAPLVMRTIGELRDLDPVEIFLPQSPDRDLLGFEGARLWRLPWVGVDDPLGHVLAVGDTWGDIDALVQTWEHAWLGTPLASASKATEASTAQSRTNWAARTRGLLITGWATWTLGTGETGSTSYPTGIVGPEGTGITTASRRTTTAKKTVTTATGWSASTSTYRNAVGVGGATGDQVTVSIFARYTGDGYTSLALSATCYTAGGVAAGTAATAEQMVASSAPEADAAGWVRLSVTVTATAAFASIGWTLLHTTEPPQAGSTLEITGLLIESGPLLGSFFDGNTPKSGAWADLDDVWPGSTWGEWNATDWRGAM